MGSKTSKEERQQREQVKADTFQRAKQNVIEQHRNKSRALIPHDPFASSIQQAKIDQLDRKGRPFTKADLIALLCRLKNEDENSPTLLHYRALSCDDLRAYIRLIVYSPDTLQSEHKGGGGSNANVNIKSIEEVPPQQYQPIEEAKPVMDYNYQPGLYTPASAPMSQPQQPGLVQQPPPMVQPVYHSTPPQPAYNPSSPEGTMAYATTL